MLETLQKKLQSLEAIPPWRGRIGTSRNFISEGLGAPEPGEHDRWQSDLAKLREQIDGLVNEEDARRQINRP